jgi:hypothetical protein
LVPADSFCADSSSSCCVLYLYCCIYFILLSHSTGNGVAAHSLTQEGGTRIGSKPAPLVEWSAVRSISRLLHVTMPRCVMFRAYTAPTHTPCCCIIVGHII